MIGTTSNFLHFYVLGSDYTWHDGANNVREKPTQTEVAAINYAIDSRDYEGQEEFKNRARSEARAADDDRREYLIPNKLCLLR